MGYAEARTTALSANLSCWVGNMLHLLDSFDESFVGHGKLAWGGGQLALAVLFLFSRTCITPDVCGCGNARLLHGIALACSERQPLYLSCASIRLIIKSGCQAPSPPDPTASSELKLSRSIGQNTQYQEISGIVSRKVLKSFTSSN